MLAWILLSSLILANMTVVASIPPIASLVRAVGGEDVDVVTMVAPGNSPHTYEPKPSQMKALARASLYVAVGVEFEKVWLPKFRQLNPRLAVLQLDENITKLPMLSHRHGHEEEHGKHAHEEHGEDEGLDPHIWTSPANMRLFAARIAGALCEADAARCEGYRRRAAVLDADIAALDGRIRALLALLPPHTAFMSVHPSWGYYAHEYGLVQLAAEVEGKGPKPAQLAALIQRARKARVRTLLTQPEFSDAVARILARELGIPVLKVSPLDADWQGVLLRITEAIAGVRR